MSSQPRTASPEKSLMSGLSGAAQTDGDQPTQDADIVVEEMRVGYRRYRRLSDGRRWEVHGVCIGRGDCLVGSVLDDDTVVESLEHLGRLKDERGADFLEKMYQLDSPVTPEFEGCCPFSYVELDPAPPAG